MKSSIPPLILKQLANCNEVTCLHRHKQNKDSITVAKLGIEITVVQTHSKESYEKRKMFGFICFIEQLAVISPWKAQTKHLKRRAEYSTNWTTRPSHINKQCKHHRVRQIHTIQKQAKSQVYTWTNKFPKIRKANENSIAP